MKIALFLIFLSTPSLAARRVEPSPHPHRGSSLSVAAVITSHPHPASLPGREGRSAIGSSFAEEEDGGDDDEFTDTGFALRAPDLLGPLGCQPFGAHRALATRSPSCPLHLRC